MVNNKKVKVTITEIERAVDYIDFLEKKLKTSEEEKNSCLKKIKNLENENLALKDTLKEVLNKLDKLNLSFYTETYPNRYHKVLDRLKTIPKIKGD